MAKAKIKKINNTRAKIKTKRKIAFIITSFIHYSRNLLLLEALEKRDDVELHIVVGGSALIPKYTAKHADIKSLLRADGHDRIHELFFHLEGDTRVAKAKTAGLATVEFSSLFNEMKPDLIVVRADRFEVLAATMAAVYMNIPVAHIEGGDVSGTIDESVRHAITKLAHLHFVTNEDAEQRVHRLGENPRSVFCVGSPDVEVARTFAVVPKKGIPQVQLDDTGSGKHIDLAQPYLMVMYHPVWQESEDAVMVQNSTRELLQAVSELKMQTLWFWPNADFGAEIISRELRVFKENNASVPVHFLRYLPPKEFLQLLGSAIALIGNSSAGIKECSYLGVPVVNIGTRQWNRLRGNNVLDASPNATAIKRAVEDQMAIGRYTKSVLYDKKNTAQRIAVKLATASLSVQKTFFE